MSNPVAVLISDVHYSLNTFELADLAFRQAIDKAAELGVPLVDCGDLTNDKAVLRAEYVNKIINTMIYAKSKKVNVYCIVGNHSLINEKSEEHSLNFLEPYCTVVDRIVWIDELGSWLLPYSSDSKAREELLEYIQKPSRIIAHTGVLGADMGHYIKDTSSLPKEVFSDLRVISGHYHKRQDIKTGRPRKGAVGLFSYVGNPYTLGFGESDHPEKGFQILHDDGLLEFVPTNLRRHRIVEYTIAQLSYSPANVWDPRDLHWIKVTGTRNELSQWNKRKVGSVLFGNMFDFKLDFIATDEPKMEQRLDNLDSAQLMDLVIDNTGESEEYRKDLKGLWRQLC